MKIGFLELVVVFVVALLVIGPDKLPGFAQKLGAALKEFRKAAAEATRDVRENVVEPLEEAQRPIREAMEPLEELSREVREDIQGVERDLRGLGKPSSASKVREDGGPSPARDVPEAGESNITDNEAAGSAAADGENMGGERA